MKRFLKIIGIMLAVIFALLIFGDMVFVLVFGWIPFLSNTLGKMTFEPIAFWVGFVARAAIPADASTLAMDSQWPASVRKRTPTVAIPLERAIAAIAVFFFAAGICIIVTIHQAGWLLVDTKPWFDSSSGSIVRRMRSSNNLKQIGLACLTYEQEKHQLPPGGTFDENGEMLHSWETMLLPYLDQPNMKPDMSLLWSHPDNAKWFETAIPAFMIPGIYEHDVDAQGYALSHYAANSRVLGGNHSMRLEEITDGASNTILFGEVHDGFKPWGHPVNYRDPALGINKSPDGFGGPWKLGGANMVFADGSVHFVSKKADPAILRALATPNGGETHDLSNLNLD